MKTCLDCKEEKPLDDFNRRKTAKDGRQSRCKVCERARCQEYYQQNKARLLDKRIEHYENNKEATKKKVAEYRRKNPDKVKNQRAEYHKKYGELIALVERNKRKRDVAGTLLKYAKRKALAEGLMFNLSREALHVPKVCPHFGYELKVNSGSPKYNSYSLRRIDKSLGYTHDNVEIVSYSATKRL